jgi:hypothetical protein
MLTCTRLTNAPSTCLFSLFAIRHSTFSHPAAPASDFTAAAPATPTRHPPSPPGEKKEALLQKSPCARPERPAARDPVGRRSPCPSEASGRRPIGWAAGQPAGWAAGQPADGYPEARARHKSFSFKDLRKGTHRVSATNWEENQKRCETNPIFRPGAIKNAVSVNKKNPNERKKRPQNTPTNPHEPIPAAEPGLRSARRSGHLHGGAHAGWKPVLRRRTCPCHPHRLETGATRAAPARRDQWHPPDREGTAVSFVGQRPTYVSRRIPSPTPCPTVGRGTTEWGTLATQERKDALTRDVGLGEVDVAGEQERADF